LPAWLAEKEERGAKAPRKKPQQKSTTTAVE
jgi:hypothetical protein